MARVPAEWRPCFQALRLPPGAPLPLPPCIRHRALPPTAGDRHGVPARVRAPQRVALARISGWFPGCMGLFARFCINFFLGGLEGVIAQRAGLYPPTARGHSRGGA